MQGKISAVSSLVLKNKQPIENVSDFHHHGYNT